VGLFWVKNVSAQSEILGMTPVLDVLSAGAVHSVFQPIVELDGGAVVAYEALARGPQGPLATPDALFAAAREAGLLSELDTACRTAAFRGALEQGLLAPLTVFVNVEPEVLDSAPLDDLLAIAGSAPGELRVVMEITERALSVRPADLLRTVERVREFGWAVALDDVGADPLSLAFMALQRPDVVKLDLRLVQERPGSDVAQIMNAVNAYAEQTGALVLAEGIQNEQHLTMAWALGARLGQGWLFGRPAPGAATGRPVARPARCCPACHYRAVAVRMPARRRRTAPLTQGAADRAEQTARTRGDESRPDVRGRRHLPTGPALHPGHQGSLPRPGGPYRVCLRAG
jgi:EAL domain-containing protein (putative c-di-GMP-specific phosphodiesterase class I)